VVDDHDLVRNGVKSLLARQGTLEVVGEGRNGREAVELVRQLRPDVVVMDIRMPVMDGVEATRQIHAEWPEVVIVGVSAFGDESFRPTMLGAGAAGLLDKADAGSKLPALIASCLAARNKGATR
jgi:DNA-binding NarL/FixJ family response regulator